jgi:hypothetical protein
MRSLILVLSAFAIVGFGFWAYRENYRTQAELGEVRRLHAEIGDMREALSVLNAEWAYLNRPDRLRELAEINFERLGLLPFEPRQFGTVAAVSYPAVALPPITEPVDTVALSGALDGATP